MTTEPDLLFEMRGHFTSACDGLMAWTEPGKSYDVYAGPEAMTWIHVELGRAFKYDPSGVGAAVWKGRTFRIHKDRRAGRSVLVLPSDGR